MSWRPTEKRGRRRLGRGSRGMELEIEEGILERIEMSYTGEVSTVKGK